MLWLNFQKKRSVLITNRFYSCFCGTDISEAESGVTFVCSESRNEELRGLGRRYTIYMLVKDDVCVVSYAPEYTDFFRKRQGMNAAGLLTETEASFRVRKTQLMEFVRERVREYGDARVLVKNPITLCMRNSSARRSPAANPDGWLREYFEEKAAKEYFTGLNDRRYPSATRRICLIWKM